MSNKFRENDLVWAKMRGYPSWPAKVQKPPKGLKPPANKLYIFFFGSHNYAWMSPVNLFPYEEHKEKFCKLEKRRKGFAEAIWEIQEDPSLAISSPVHLPRRKSGKKGAESDSGTPAAEPPTGKSWKRRLSSRGEGPPSKKSKEEEKGGGGGGGELEGGMGGSSARGEAQDIPFSQESYSQVERVTQGGMRMRSRSKLSPPELFCPSFSPSGHATASRVGRRGRGGAEGVRTGSGRTTSESSVGKKAIRSSRRIKKEPVQLESVVVQSQPGVGSSVSADTCDSVVEERREEGKKKKEGVDKDMEALREAVVELKYLDVVGIRHDKECMESERGKLKTVMKSGRPATVESTVEYQLTFHSDRNHTSRQEHLTGEEEAKPVQDEAQKPQTQTSQGRVVLQPKGEGVKHQLSNGEVMQQPGQEGEGIGLQPLQEEGNEMESEGVKHHLPQQAVDQQPVKKGERLGAPQEASMSAQNGLEASPTVRLSFDELRRVIPIQPGMNNVEMLQAYNCNLMAALTIESPNVHQAMVVLRDLLELQFTIADLERVPNLVATIRKLRHYHASQKVIKRADEVYHKLKGLHLRPNQVVVPSRKRSLVAGGVRQRLPIRTVTAPVATSSGGSITDVTSHKPSVHQEKLAMTPVMPTVLSNGMKEEPPSLRRSSRGTAQNKVDYSKMDQGSTESSGTEGNDQTVPM